VNQFAATGISYGALPKAEHARIAIEKAKQNLGSRTISSVLLFLTNGYAHAPQEALREAARASSTTQIFGCCSSGLITDQEWLIDAQGAAAMVFSNDCPLQPLNLIKQTPDTSLVLCAPSNATQAVNEYDIPMLGALSSDEYGHGPFPVWQSAKLVEKGYINAAFTGSVRTQIRSAPCTQQLSPIARIDRCNGHSLVEINGQSAVDSLFSSLPDNLTGISRKQAYNLLCAVSENIDSESLRGGNFKLHHIVSIDEEKGVIHLSGSIKEKHYLYWAMRDETVARKRLESSVTSAAGKHRGIPDFAILFSNIGRGPEFYGGQDQDIEIFKSQFPTTPFIGLYSNGEVAPGQKLAGLIRRYSTTFGLYSVD
jgi:small ligand-binding sensory domain FIST